MNNKSTPKQKTFFYIILILIPVTFFILLEAALKVFDYGTDYTQFVQFDEQSDDWIMLNSELPKKYFAGTSMPPAIVPDAFFKEKPDSAFRVFVLGGSSAAGWPFNFSATFPRYIKRALKTMYPRKTIEVINLGMSAINSYTILDFVPDMLKQKPDLVLIYAGHNEYYGALGVGSTQSLGRFRPLVNLIIKLRNYRTVQLIQDVIASAVSIFATSGEARGTLMARMIGEGIPYKSDIYYAGIDQFSENMKDVLEEIKAADVPVIIGTLTENLMQKPFMPETIKGGISALSIFNDAQQQLADSKFDQAEKLFEKARDYDALRFRAPREINKTIKSLAEQFEIPIANVDSAFRAESPNGIPGTNLMVDHLHPTREGYQLIGKTYLEKMIKKNLLPGKPAALLAKVDEFVKHSTPFTELDSIIADIKIRLLLGSFPFVPPNEPNKLMQEFKLNNYLDSLASEVYFKDTGWQEAHLKLAEKYFEKRQYIRFMREIDAVLDDRPYAEYVYYQTAKNLIAAKKYVYALRYLEPLNKLHENDYTTKWLGNISLIMNRTKQAAVYLEKSLKYNQNDPQVHYNLSGAYYKLGDIERAVDHIEKCLKINPKYPNAKRFYGGLLKLKKP